MQLRVLAVSLSLGVSACNGLPGDAAPAPLRTKALDAALSITTPTLDWRVGAGCKTLVATAGTAPFAWSFVTNASGGTIDPATGSYCPGLLSTVVDVVRVTDALAATATASITVYPALTIQPGPPPYTTPGKVIAFTASGGTGVGRTWSLVGVGSGGSIGPTSGVYLAGPNVALDRVQIDDSVGAPVVLYVPVEPAAAPGGGRWQAVAPMLTPRAGHALVALGGLLYAIGGYDVNGTPLNSVEAYDSATNQWTPRRSLHTPRYNLGAVALGGKIYAIAGVVTDVEVYDPLTDLWTQKANWSTSTWGPGVAVASGRIIAAGGSDDLANVYYTTVQEYLPGSDTWTTLAPLSTTRGALAAASLDGKFYAIGGTNPVVQASVEVYDTTLGTWSTTTPMKQARLYLTAASAGGKVYAIGGDLFQSLSTVEEYDPGTATWTTRAPLSTPRQQTAAAELGGVIYVAGGFDGTSVVGSVERYVATRPVAQDMDGDGKSDILWRSTSSGLVYAFLAQGTNGTDYLPFYVTTQPLNYRVAGMGDLDGNGRADILWYGSTLGDVYLYAATGPIGPNFFTPRFVGSQPSEWQIAGVGDFDGDGKSDVLWRSTVSGMVYALLATGTNGTDFAPFYVTTQPLNYEIAGIGDFDGNGRSDILWRGTTLGDVYLYAATGNTPSNFFTPRYVGSQPPEWRITGVGDFDGDGKSDILWRSASSGLVYAFLAQGTNGTDYLPFYVTSQPLTYQVEAIGDYDGNGRDDILWRGSTLGDVYLYAAVGTVGPGFFQARYVGSQPTEWQIVP